EADRAVGLAHERHVRVRIAVDRDGLEAHAPCRAEDASRDLAAIRDEKDGHRSQRARRRSRNARIPSWPSALTRRAAMRSIVRSRTSAIGRPATSRTMRFAAFTACGP